MKRGAWNREERGIDERRSRDEKRGEDERSGRVETRGEAEPRGDAETRRDERRRSAASRAVRSGRERRERGEAKRDARRGAQREASRDERREKLVGREEQDDVRPRAGTETSCAQRPREERREWQGRRTVCKAKAREGSEREKRGVRTSEERTLCHL